MFYRYRWCAEICITTAYRGPGFRTCVSHVPGRMTSPVHQPVPTEQRGTMAMAESSVSVAHGVHHVIDPPIPSLQPSQRSRPPL